MSKKYSLTVTLFTLLLIYPQTALATTYYVAPGGNDANNGTSSSTPYKTFTKATTGLSAGDTLLLMGGTYTTTLDLTKNGTSGSPITVKPVEGQSVVIDLQNTGSYGIRLRGNYINVSGPSFKITKSKWTGIEATGQNLVIDNLEVFDIVSHGIINSGKNITVKNTKIYETVKENLPYAPNNSFGSGLKIYNGGENITFENNLVYNNYGEGIASTRGANVIIRNNVVYDNFSVGIYIDNSRDVLVENNISTCDVNSHAIDFHRDNVPSTGIALAEEDYPGWGNQLKNIMIRNNVVGYCSGLYYWGADAGVGGLRNVKVLHNTFYGSPLNSINLAAADDTADTEIAYNLFHTVSPRNPIIADKTGITVHDNYWIGSLTTSVLNGLGSNNQSGPTLFKQTPNHSLLSTYELTHYTYGANPASFGSTMTTPSPSPIPSPSPVFKPGDLNHDGSVNIFDFNLLISKFGNPYTIFDFNAIVTNYGK